MTDKHQPNRTTPIYVLLFRIRLVYTISIHVLILVILHKHINTDITYIQGEGKY